MKKRKIYLIIVIPILVVLIGLAVLFARQIWLDVRMNDDYSSMYTDERYQKKLSLEDFPVISQEVTCGYACIELLADWNEKELTEVDLLKMNDDKITTSIGNGFEDEMNKQFPEFTTTKMSNLKNTDLLMNIYSSLGRGNPIPVQFAALDSRDGKSKWTLHYAVVIGMDLKEDSITLSNPYGYIESYSVKDFLEATSFRSYEKMELPLKFGFLGSMFTKNTIYIIADSKIKLDK